MVTFNSAQIRTIVFPVGSANCKMAVFSEKLSTASPTIVEVDLADRGNPNNIGSRLLDQPEILQRWQNMHKSLP